MEGVPIKVNIGLRPDGNADHPDWQKLPLAASRKPEEDQIVKWKYDKTSGHQEHTADSPRGMQWGMMIVTQQYADEAVATFPGIVTIMTEAQAQDFWDNKAHAHIPENRIDTDYLVGLKAERDLRLARSMSTTDVDARIDKALDPLNPELGVRKEKLKVWADAKKVLDVTVKAAAIE